MQTNLVYMTAGSLEEAREVGKTLVGERLAACVNIIDNMTSMFWWEGEVQDDKEVIVIAKTKESLVSALVERVKAVHSYDCPCIITLPIGGGNEDFLDWIGDETK